MPTFVLNYRTRTTFDPTPETTAAWMSWFDGIKDQIVDMGKPVVETTSLGDCDPTQTRIGGYSVVRADDLESAVAIAKGCPVLGRNGGVEIGLLAEIPTAS